MADKRLAQVVLSIIRAKEEFDERNASQYSQRIWLRYYMDMNLENTARRFGGYNGKDWRKNSDAYLYSKRDRHRDDGNDILGNSYRKAQEERRIRKIGVKKGTNPIPSNLQPEIDEFIKFYNLNAGYVNSLILDGYDIATPPPNARDLLRIAGEVIEQNAMIQGTQYIPVRSIFELIVRKSAVNKSKTDGSIESNTSARVVSQPTPGDEIQSSNNNNNRPPPLLRKRLETVNKVLPKRRRFRFRLR